MTSIRSEDRSVCEQRVFSARTPFLVSYRFVPQQTAERLIALRAMFDMVRSVPLEVSDPSVALAKLSWWQKELGEGRFVQSQHPVVRALRDSGAIDQLAVSTLNDYFAAIAEAVLIEVVEDEAALLERADGIGGAEALIEADCVANDPIAPALRKVGAAAYLSGLLRQMQAGKAGISGWLPLELQARFGVAAGSLDPVSGDERFHELSVALAKLARDILAEAIGGLSAACAQSGIYHLLVHAELEQRFLLRLIANPATVVRPRLWQALGDVTAAWRRARQLRQAV